MANTTLTRNMTTQGSAIKGTFSAWVKRSKISLGAGGVDSDIYQHNYSSDYRFIIIFTSDDKLRIGDYRDNAGGWVMKKDTNALYRDTNAWYHIYVAIDRSLATAEDRQKVYVNGERITSWSSSTDYSQQTSGGHSGAGYPSMNNNYNGIIGGRENSTDYFDGLISHLYWVDGSVIDIAQFGSTDATTGEWKINTGPTIASYGTNGHSHFKDVASVNDASSNNNHFTSNGTGITKTEDNPSNVFCTLNPLSTDSGVTLSSGNTESDYDGSVGNAKGTLGFSSGKFYWEVKIATADSNYPMLGIGSLDEAQMQKITGGSYPGGFTNSYGTYGNGNVYANGSNTGSQSFTYGTGDIIGIAVDLDSATKTIKWYKNGNSTAIASTNITTTAPFTSMDYNGGESAVNIQYNFGNGKFGTTSVSSAGTNASNLGIFEYDVPTGYTALCTKGLNE